MLGDDVLVIVLAGGAGERLSPLTRDRAEPAVYFGGPYRIIDFVLSNCINSGLRHIFIATQYKSLSLNRHIRRGWTGALLVAAPLAAIFVAQAVIYFDQRDLGWVDRSWREMGVSPLLSFAFWQWLAVAFLWAGLGHLLWRQRMGVRGPDHPA